MNEYDMVHYMDEIRILKDRITKLESLNRDNEYQKIMTAKQQEKNIFTKKHTWDRKKG
jgi:uncharacterized protein YktA (UPF0223 family)